MTSNKSRYSEPNDLTEAPCAKEHAASTKMSLAAVENSDVGLLK
jgi:hypothetical protein